MWQIRRAEDRGHADHGWLKSAHTFSFANYFDPEFRGFRDLLVINDDRVAAGRGFGTHPHNDMEIVTYVIDGALAHQDTMGNREVLRAGEVQRMSAGTGIRHSEMNASSNEPVHFLQMWVMPGQNGLKPSYEQKAFDLAERKARWRTILAPEGGEGAMTIHQDVRLLATFLTDGDEVSLSVPAGRFGWLHVATGKASFGDGTELAAGDGVAFDSDEAFTLRGTSADAQILLWDLR